MFSMVRGALAMLHVDTGMTVDLAQLLIMMSVVAMATPLTLMQPLLGSWATINGMLLGMRLVVEDDAEHVCHWHDHGDVDDT